MSDSQKDASFSFPVIDVPATSINLKRLRESRGISVANLQLKASKNVQIALGKYFNFSF
ncbi:MAG: hypothetical protein IK024_05595 [Treponema sp.]|nr:hypothetical protein [Treponema sp.]